MRKTEMSNVHWLTVGEVAELWAPELNLPVTTIERELRIGLYKLEHDYPFDKPIDVNPESLELPSASTVIDRSFIERFHGKELWKLPDFWFKELPTAPSFSGRPSVMSAIVHELEVRAQRGDLAETLAEQARQLSDWARQAFPGQQTPKPGGTENGIRTAFNALRRGAQ